MDPLKKWRKIENLGEGGQGKVFRVLERDADSKIKSTLVTTHRRLGDAMADPKHHEENCEAYCNALLEMLKIQDPSGHGALKVLHEPDNARDAGLAKERIRREIRAMSENLHSNLIRIIDVDPESSWHVSQFYPNGTLAHRIEMYKGNFYRSLKAIRPLVAAVATLHDKGYVHRDIKPKNIFLSSNDDLILGDFGLIHFADDQHTRLSHAYENVGSRDWMPPWAMGVRIEEIKPTFDVFSLGKLLWSMVSGKPVLQLWYFDSDRFNVEKLFPESRNLRLANQLFSKCIVELEKKCLQDAGELLRQIDETLECIVLGADVIDLDIERTCRVCGIGKYNLLKSTVNFGIRPAGDRQFKIFTCSHCGNVELFSHTARPPDAWRK
ncbi:protein kinase [Planctomycetota bacterium]